MEIKHRHQLPELLKHFDLPLTTVEVGCAESLHSADLLRNGIEKLYCVDNWGRIPNQKGDGGFPDSWHQKNFEDSKERLKEYGDKVIFLRGMSVEMAKHIPDESLGLVYIDCDHSYNGVLNDINAYWNKLVDGGIMGFHDFDNPAYAVKEAVEHFVSGTGIEIHLIPENKKEAAGCWIRKPIAH